MREGLRNRGIPALTTAAVAALSFYALSFPLNERLSATMPLHQAVQLPAMVLIGLAVGARTRRWGVKDLSSGLTVLVLAMGTLIFWMLPRSIDLAVIHPAFNRVMHVSMAGAGFLVAITLRHMPFEARIAFPGMVASMLLAMGGTLRSFTIQLCSSFTIEQQHATGMWLLVIGTALFIGTAVTFIRGLGRR